MLIAAARQSAATPSRTMRRASVSWAARKCGVCGVGDVTTDRQAPHFGEAGPAGISRDSRNSQIPAPPGRQRETSR